MYVWKKEDVGQHIYKPDIAILLLASCVSLWKIEEYPEDIIVD